MHMGMCGIDTAHYRCPDHGMGLAYNGDWYEPCARQPGLWLREELTAFAAQGCCPLLCQSGAAHALGAFVGNSTASVTCYLVIVHGYIMCAAE